MTIEKAELVKQTLPFPRQGVDEVSIASASSRLGLKKEELKAKLETLQTTGGLPLLTGAPPVP